MFKVVLLGDNNVGKTTLLHRFCDGYFQCHDATIDHEFTIKEISALGKSIMLHIWDTPGHRRYNSVTRMYCRGSSAAVVFYDLTNEESLQCFQYWLALLLREEQKCRIYACGTKADVYVESESGQSCSQDLVGELMVMYDIPGHRRFHTSSKTGDGISELFITIGEEGLQDKEITSKVEKSFCVCS